MNNIYERGLHSIPMTVGASAILFWAFPVLLGYQLVVGLILLIGFFIYPLDSKLRLE